MAQILRTPLPELIDNAFDKVDLIRLEMPQRCLLDAIPVDRH